VVGRSPDVALDEGIDGRFTRHEDRQAAMRFAFQNAGVDCVTVGFKSTQEIDEAIDNLNLALA
jgi:aryl-alcohol dehydrogenase-like predicted oxidoreductase